MAHAFDIRFARSSGLAAFLQAPTNTFRWKGAGRLSIDPDDISITVKRGAFGLFPHTRRVSATDLRGVLREGEALRVEFATNNNSRAVVLFWVRDQETAEEIVRLLPTSQTVELDHDAAGVAQAQVGIDWRAVSLFAAALLVIAGSAWMLRRSDAPVSVAQTEAEMAVPESSSSAAPAAEMTQTEVESASPAEHTRATPSGVSPGVTLDESDGGYPVSLSPPDPDAPASPPAEVTPELPPVQPTTTDPAGNADVNAPNVRRGQAIDGVVAILPGMPAYAAGRRQLDLFNSETANFRCANAGWWQVSVRIYNDPEFNNPALWPLQEMELAVSRAWRSCLHDGDFAKEFAERLTERLELYVR